MLRNSAMPYLSIYLSIQRLGRIDQLHVRAAARDVLRAQQAVGEQEHLDRAKLRRRGHGPQPIRNSVGRRGE